jgi:phage terminase small subunit
MNERNERFARVFAETGSITQAAAAAGYQKHLSSRGSDLLKRPDVAARVKTLVAQRLANTGELAPETVRHLGSPSDALAQIAQIAAFALGSAK